MLCIVRQAWFFFGWGGGGGGVGGTKSFINQKQKNHTS